MRSRQVAIFELWLKHVLGAFALVLLCSGCALTTARIDVPYQPVSGAAMGVPGANSVFVTVTARDGRTTYRDRVGSKKNGYGMEMAAIIATNDLPISISDAFTRELVARGFRIGPQGAAVNVEFVRFYNDFKTGFFSGDAVATVAFNVKVTSPGAGVIFTKYYEGTGTEPGIQISSGDNARAALIKAFAASVNSALSDPDFIHAVLTAGSTAPRSIALLHTGS